MIGNSGFMMLLMISQDVNNKYADADAKKSTTKMILVDLAVKLDILTLCSSRPYK